MRTRSLKRPISVRIGARDLVFLPKGIKVLKNTRSLRPTPTPRVQHRPAWGPRYSRADDHPSTRKPRAPGTPAPGLGLLPMNKVWRQTNTRSLHLPGKAGQVSG